MKTYKTDYSWEFNDNEAKYENGTTALFLKEEEIGTVEADSEKIVYRIDRKHKDFMEYYMYDFVIKTKRKEAEAYLDNEIMVKRDEKSKLTVYSDIDDFSDFLKIACSHTVYSNARELRDVDGKFIGVYMNGKIDGLISNKKVSLSIEDIVETEKTELGYIQKKGKKFFIQSADLVDTVKLYEQTLKMSNGSEMWKDISRLLKKIIDEKLIGEDFEWDFDKLEDENKVTPETLYTFQTVYNLTKNFNYSKILELAKENINGPELSLIFSLKSKKLNGNLLLEKKQAIFRPNENKVSLINILEMADELKELVKLGYSLNIEPEISNQSLNFTEDKNVIKIKKKSYAKTDFQKLRKFSEKTGKSIGFHIMDEYKDFIITGNKLQIIHPGTHIQLSKKFEDLELYFLTVEKIEK